MGAQTGQHGHCEGMRWRDSTAWHPKLQLRVDVIRRALL